MKFDLTLISNSEQIINPTGLTPKMYSSMLRKYQVLFWCVTLHYHTEWVNEKFLYKHFDGLLLPKLNVNCNYLKYKGTKKLNCVRICTHCKRLHVYKHFWKILIWKKNWISAIKVSSIFLLLFNTCRKL